MINKVCTFKVAKLPFKQKVSHVLLLIIRSFQFFFR